MLTYQANLSKLTRSSKKTKPEQDKSNLEEEDKFKNNDLVPLSEQ